MKEESTYMPHFDPEKGDVLPEDAAQMGEPEQEDCSRDSVPAGVTDMNGKKVILVPELISMVKVFFDRYKREMIRYLSDCLADGTISKVVGEKVLNKTINRAVCTFPSITFWRTDRESFYADVCVELKLRTEAGNITWKGVLICWCVFREDLICHFEQLVKSVDRSRDEYDLLNPFLVPYSTNKRVDEISEEIWNSYIPEALKNPGKRVARELAEKMGLHIEYHPVYEHRGVRSIIFFKEDRLAIGEDRTEKDKKGKKKRIKAPSSKPVIIPANTIVINTNLIRQDYSAYNIYHECYHYQEHYLFFRLQEMGSNDLRQVEMKEVIVGENEEPKDPVYFMEKQANRGGYGLMMPATDTRKLIWEEAQKAENYRHGGEKYEMAGLEIAKKIHLPHFRIRARMIQLGFIEAKGALNYADNVLIEPFAFDIEAWREDQHTFVVEEDTVKWLRKGNPELDELFTSGKYVYADGHAVRNDPRFVWWNEEKQKLLLTEKANRRVDGCCLRFIRRYVQRNIGRYIYGRMYYDADYVKQTRFYLNDLINQEQMDELDAMDRYIEVFPMNFKDAIDELKRQYNGNMKEKGDKVNNAKLAEYMNMDDSTFSRWLEEPRYYRNENFLMMLCLYFKLPDWISRLVFKRARYQLDEDDKRHRALLHILRVQSNDGLKAANEYLESVSQEPISL